MSIEPILDWGVAVIAFLQQASPILDLPFSAITWLGNVGFFAVALPILFWCVDRDLGLRVAYVFLLSAIVNALLKITFQQPRPASYDSSVRMIRESEGYGFPSGHTQNAVVFWGWLAYTVKRRWLTVLAVALIVLIPLSRVYLGVHFPTDLLGGYVFGGILLWLIVCYGERVTQGAGGLPLWAKLALGTAIPGVVALLLLSHYEDGLTATGTVIGLLCGAALDSATTRYSAEGSLKQRLLRLSLGLAGLGVVYLALEFATASLAGEGFWRVVRYGALGLWVAWGAPALFVRIGLAGRLTEDS